MKRPFLVIGLVALVGAIGCAAETVRGPSLRLVVVLVIDQLRRDRLDETLQLRGKEPGQEVLAPAGQYR